MNYHFDVAGIADRKAEIRRSTPAAHVRQRLAEAAQRLSLAGTLQSRVEMANEGLCHLVELLYQVDIDGAWANVDPITFRVLLPLPWGSAGWRRWGLRYHEALVMRAIMLDRMRRPRPAPLFEYNDQGRTWHLAADQHPDQAAAMRYLERHPLLLAEWRDALANYRSAAVTVQERRRNGGVTL